VIGLVVLAVNLGLYIFVYKTRTSRAGGKP